MSIDSLNEKMASYVNQIEIKKVDSVSFCFREYSNENWLVLKYNDVCLIIKRLKKEEFKNIQKELKGNTNILTQNFFNDLKNY